MKTHRKKHPWKRNRVMILTIVAISIFTAATAAFTYHVEKRAEERELAGSASFNQFLFLSYTENTQHPGVKEILTELLSQSENNFVVSLNLKYNVVGSLQPSYQFSIFSVMFLLVGLSAKKETRFYAFIGGYLLLCLALAMWIPATYSLSSTLAIIPTICTVGIILELIRQTIRYKSSK